MRPRRRRAARHGFTLVEIVVVLVVIGLVLGVATPAFVQLAATEPDGATTVRQLLDGARRTALEDGSTVEVAIDPASSRVWLWADGAAPPLDSTFVLRLPPGTTLAATRPRIRYRFHPDGSGWGDTLVVRDGAASARLVIEPLAGAVHLERVGTVP
jgi:prepilin-type N-terminal cleavage/methylation domain-containing protein